MGARWSLTERDRQTIKRLLIGENYDSSKPLLQQLAEIGPIFPNGPLARLLAGQTHKPEKTVEEWERPPPDYYNPEEWSKLPETEKRYIYECLKVGRKVYISVPQEEGLRGKLDGITLEKQRLQKVLTTEW